MEALATFGLACNVIQVVDFSLKTASQCKEIVAKGTTDKLDDYGKVSEQLGQLSLDLEKSIDNAPQPVTKGDSSLLMISREVSRTARDVQSKLNDVLIKDKRQRGKVSKMRKVITSSESLEKLHEALRRQEDVLNTRLLVDLSQRQDDIRNLQQHHAAELDDQLWDFIDKLSNGLTNVEALLTTTQEAIRIEHIDTRRAVQHDGDLTRDLVHARLQALESHMAATRYQGQFIQSLYFPEIWLRHDEIAQAHENTYKWIFSDRDQHDDEDDDDSSIDHRASDEANSTNHRETDNSHKKATEQERGVDRGSLSSSTLSNGSIEEPEFSSKNANTLRPPWDNFAVWLQDQTPLYWIWGKAGSGKSTLMKFISDHEYTKQLLGETKSAEVVVLRAFFWKAGTLLQRSVRGLLRSLLYQMCRDDMTVAEAILQHDPELKFRTPGAEWSVQHLMKLLTAGLNQSRKSIYIFVDGLDEFKDDIGGLEPADLLAFFDRLVARTTPKLCISSRPEGPLKSHMKKYFTGSPQMNLEDLTRADIKRYVTDKLTHHANLQHISKKGRDALASDVTEKADGVFLWVFLVVKSLLRGLDNADTIEILHERIRKLPSRLEDLFATMWSRLDEDEEIYQKEASLLFRLTMLTTDVQQGSLPSLVAIAVASNPHLADIVLMQDSLRSLCPIVQACERVRDRISVISGDLLEMKMTPNKNEKSDDANIRFSTDDWTTPESCPSLGFLVQARDNFSEEQRDNWKKLRIFQATTVGFIHRSAIDFLKETKRGRHILLSESSPEFEMIMQVLNAICVTWSLHLECFRAYHIAQLLASLAMIRSLQESLTKASCQERRNNDVLRALNHNLNHILLSGLGGSQERVAKWFTSKTQAMEESPVGPDDFLGYAVITAAMVVRSSPCLMSELQTASHMYKSYLLTCAVRPGWLDIKFDHQTCSILLENGADPNSGCDAITNLQSEDSAWSILLDRCYFRSSLNDDEAKKACLLFQSYGADPEEVIIQVLLFTRRKTFRYLHLDNLDAVLPQYIGPQNYIMRSAKAWQLTQFYRDDLVEVDNRLVEWTYILHNNRNQFFKLVPTEPNHCATPPNPHSKPFRSDDVANIFQMIENSTSQSILEENETGLISICSDDALEYLGIEAKRSCDYQRRFLRFLGQRAQWHQQKEEFLRSFEGKARQQKLREWDDWVGMHQEPRVEDRRRKRVGNWKTLERFFEH